MAGPLSLDDLNSVTGLYIPVGPSGLSFTPLQKTDVNVPPLTRHACRSYSYFIFINSSTKGPFYPSYVPSDWHWTHAYLARFKKDIHAVSSSLVCLPESDLGDIV